MTKEKIFLIILLAIACLFSAITINNKLSEKSDMRIYSNAIKFYQDENYQDAYYNFARISNFSILKPAALFREARCATNIGDTQSAIRNYSILLKRFPNCQLYPVSEYNLAVLLFDRQDYFIAKRHFKHLIRKYPKTEVAIASKYYLGLIEKNPKLLFEYLELSPNGLLSQNAIDTLIEWNTKFSNPDNLTIAKSYLSRDKFNEALEYYQKTSLPDSWAGYAKTLYKLGKYNEAKNITTKGISIYSSRVDKKEIYDNIDCFVSLSDSKLTTIKYLYSLNPKSKGADYLMFLMAKYAPVSQTPQMYEKLYYAFPDGQFSGEALYKTFYSKINQRKYEEALKLGRIHLSKYGNTNSAPAVMYWMAKIYEKRHMTDMAKSYYKGVLSKYPDSYYAMRANSKLHNGQKMLENRELTVKPIVFPIKNKSEANLAIKLAKLKDYDFVQELYKDDEFVQSWVEYQRGNYTHSAFLAREAMDKLEEKPNFKDSRWRLIYPIHYYNYVQKYANKENPIIILSIIKEESHFNPNVISPVGAIGLMQLMPATADEIAKAYGLSNNLYNPENNIHLGSLYYAKMRRSLNDKDMSAIMAYNGGWAAVTRWKNRLNYTDMDDFVEKIPYPETQTYLKKVLRSYWNYSNIYQ